jgi:flavin-binding protein dodecin
MRNLRWFEVIETGGQIEDGKVRCYQVTWALPWTTLGVGLPKVL